ncbi:MAG: hypothetical protein MPN21_14285 [Thermoanaerobaculia bacterium]|nr:hypothetical protein [Thermoanaerobaculia bacterium]
MALAKSSFVEFPNRKRLLERLYGIEVYEHNMDPMVRLVADRLQGKAYDRSAFVFILLELVYEYEQDAISFGDLLGHIVFALTEDLDLVGEALEAFEEIRATLEPSGDVEERDAPALEPLPPPDDVSDLWDPVADQEQLMLELQQAQKRVADLGLTTRASIEQTLARPNKSNVGTTLRQVSRLRSRLLQFEELLRESEQKILQSIGILEGD